MFQRRGYSDVDTARLYCGGLQEGFTREAGWKERGLSIGTKVWPVPPGSHGAEALTKTFETSLKELGTDSVDVWFCIFQLYQFHFLGYVECGLTIL